MEEYKGLRLYTADEIMDMWGGDNTDESYHKLLSPERRIGWNLFVYLERTKLGDIVEALELEGAYDYAVPEYWAQKNGYPVAIWWYDKENKTFGRPLLLKEMLGMLRQKYAAKG
jgi:hypothetical protein